MRTVLHVFIGNDVACHACVLFTSRKVQVEAGISQSVVDSGLVVLITDLGLVRGNGIVLSLQFLFLLLLRCSEIVV